MDTHEIDVGPVKEKKNQGEGIVEIRKGKRGRREEMRGKEEYKNERAL